MAGLAIKLKGVLPITPPKPSDVIAETFCKCDFICDWEELVFASDEDDMFKKDYSDFLLTTVAPTDTVIFKLYRYGTEIATLDDDTYGVYYDGFTVQPKYRGFVVDWTKVYNVFGGGRYQVKIDSSILGVDSTFESRYFRLYAWDEEIANQTVKIETYQTGNIIGSDLDYTGLLAGGWYSAIRLQGTFGEATPELIEDKYLDTSYRQVQNREEVRFTYKLSCRNVPENIYKRLSGDQMISNTMLVTSYNLMAEQSYRQFPVAVTSFSDNSYKNNGRVDFSIEMTDRQQNIIKRNF